MTESNKKVLMVAYHYPPIQTSSGVHRTLAFSKYLPLHGWSSAVLTVTRNAFTDWRESNETLVPADVEVLRSVALDAHRHLSIKGKYIDALAVPDRWSSWVLPAVIKGYLYIKKHKPDLLYSTYPIASAHVIAFLLHKLTDIPWVADFRDPMLQKNYPQDEKIRSAYKWIEKKVVKNASKLIFTTSNAIEEYQSTYPEIPTDRFILIENGYDEDNFSQAESSVVNKSADTTPLVLLHSGLIYRAERDPRQFFAALSRLKADKVINESKLIVILRASGDEEYYARLLIENDISDIVKIKESLDYQSAIIEMLEVDGLLLLQAASCNRQIPAKAYEYLRCNKPVIALTDAAGNTAGLLRDNGIESIARLDDIDEIYKLIKDFVDNNDKTEYMPKDYSRVLAMSRRGRTAILAETFDSLFSA